MSDHLDKAKGALDQAGSNLRSEDYDAGNHKSVRIVQDLLDAAAVQAAVATAEACESIARSLEKMANQPIVIHRDGIQYTYTTPGSPPWPWQVTS